MKDQSLGVDVIVNDIPSNPCCTHGPTVLFERFQGNGTSRRYYACSACRDRRDCSYYHLAEQKVSQAKEEVWQSFIKEAAPKWPHKDVYNRLQDIKSLPPLQRTYCSTCSVLLSSKKKSNHSSCTLISPITDEQLCKPSTLLPPKESSRFEAQYMFVTKSTDVIIGMLEQLEAKKVLCVGTPRIFEAITTSPEKKMSALLMDIDDRYKMFFSPMEYLQYNMFNHHFFGGEQTKNIYQQFITGNEKLVVVADPPFGGRMELLGHNILTIENDWKAANNLPKDKQLSVLFIFPYFMEPQVLENLPNFTMLDYQVDYDNHPLYSSGPKGMIHGSAVRVYVNDRPSLFPLPENMGYRLCQLCDRWVRSTNRHCEKCNGCMSKDGKTYKHCDECSKCVKPSWSHCSGCKKCQPQDHKCDEASDGLTKAFTCHMCGQEGHKRMDCPERKRSLSLSDSENENKRQRIERVEKKAVVEVANGTKKNKKKNKKRNSPVKKNEEINLMETKIKFNAKGKKRFAKQVSPLKKNKTEGQKDKSDGNPNKNKKKNLMGKKTQAVKENIHQIKSRGKKNKKGKKNLT